jgi:hypothetical protein
MRGRRRKKRREEKRGCAWPVNNLGSLQWMKKCLAWAWTVEYVCYASTINTEDTCELYSIDIDTVGTVGDK